MTDHDALLAAVLNDPADDAPRLMYADYLLENAGSMPCPGCAFLQPGAKLREDCLACDGSGTVPDGRAEYSEFIDVQVELSRLPANCGRACRKCFPLSKGAAQIPCVLANQKDALRRRERELWNDDPHRKNPIATQFIRSLPEGTTAWYWQSGNMRPPFVFVRRGFVEEVRCSFAQWHGGECENCAGFGEFRRRHDNGDGPEGPCPECGGKWNSGPHDDTDSYWDAGTGRTEGIASQLIRMSDPCVKCKGERFVRVNWVSDEVVVRNAWPHIKCPDCTAGRVLRAVQPGMQPIVEVWLTDDPVDWFDSDMTMLWIPNGGTQTWDIEELRNDDSGTSLSQLVLGSLYPGITFHLPETTRPAAAR